MRPPPPIYHAVPCFFPAVVQMEKYGSSTSPALLPLVSSALLVSAWI